MLTTDARPDRMDDIRKKLMDADTLLDQGLIAIHRGASMEAMEDVYSASCLIADIRAALATSRAGADKPSTA